MLQATLDITALESERKIKIQLGTGSGGVKMTFKLKMKTHMTGGAVNDCKQFHKKNLSRLLLRSSKVTRQPNFGDVWLFLEIRKAHEIVAEILSAKVNHLQFRRSSEYS